MKRKVLAVALCAAVTGGVAALVPRFADAAEGYYVTTTGSDSQDGSKEKPFKTINKFMSIAQPGDTVYVCGGLYTDMGETYLTKSGTADKPITIRNCPGETPHLDGGGKDGVAFFYGESGQGAGVGNHIVIEGFILTNYWRSGINIGCCSDRGDKVQTVSDVTIRNNVVDHAGQNGITFMQAADVKVENNLVMRTGFDAGTGSWSSNINLYGMHGNNNVVRNNVMLHGVDVSGYHTDGNGMIVDLTYNQGSAKIENNLAFENGGAGIIITHSAPGSIINNTVYENGQEPTYVNGGVGIGYYGPESIASPVLRNNIAYQTKGKALYTSETLQGATNENNTFTTEGVQFQDPDNADFRLKPGSVGIDAGTSAGAPADGLVFDNKALKKSSAGQPISWWRYVPDLDYIKSKGEVAKIFSSSQRPQGAAVDQGAFEGDAAPGSEPPASTPTDIPSTPPSTDPSAPGDPSATPSTDPSADPSGPPGDPSTPPSGDPSAPAPTDPVPSAPPPVSGAQTIYEDDFADAWAGSAWGGRANFANKERKVNGGGTSIKMTPTQGWAAVAVSRRGGPLSAEGVTSVSLKVRGAGTGTRKLQLMVNSGSAGWGTRVPVSAPSGKWTEVTVPLTALGSPDSISTIAVQLASPTRQPAFYVDDIKLG